LEISIDDQEKDDICLENGASRICLDYCNRALNEHSMERNVDNKIKGMMKDLASDEEIWRAEDITQKRDRMVKYLKEYQWLIPVLETVKTKIPDYKQSKTVEDFMKIKYQDDRFMSSIIGMSKMTKSFLFGRYSYSMINIIAEFLDIRQCLTEYGVKVVYLEDLDEEGATVSGLRYYLIDMLVRNGYFVVDKKFKKNRKIKELKKQMSMRRRSVCIVR